MAPGFAAWRYAKSAQSPGLPDAAGAEHRAAGLTHGHDVRVIAEYGERVGCHGAGGDVQNKRHQLAGQFGTASGSSAVNPAMK